MTSSEPDPAASRRALLRRAAVTGGAAVAATTANAAPAAATTANAAPAAAPAAAATGDPVVLGGTTTGGLHTVVTSAADGGAATLALENSTGATLRLTRRPSSFGWGGGLVSTADGLGVQRVVDSAVVQHETLTTANATMLVPIPPTRVLDSRSATGRARLLEGAGRVDPQGRVLADTLLVVHLRDIVDYGDGLMGNVTVANTARGGFATVWGRGELPTASTINWWDAGQLLSNGVISQLGGYETAGGDYYPDVVAVWVAAGAAAVILDVTGLLVFHPESAVINAKAAQGGRVGAGRVRARVIREAAERGDREVRTGA
ncbi:hypothetical protein [Micromonospora sp. RL09-050-HVF-A]|uniref:hypothetical protein n=1 Tax=Micromonospora sp. RL09-050-HVF-A TaxID=1703433 RepID=UPI001C5ECCEA|nr:hypothetical protein [Micromonospora sp. RL09-050-HVF-A]MBW4702677.1 hypothetical protein [Micromonospora sp. RL09-050-HVF-A]